MIRYVIEQEFTGWCVGFAFGCATTNVGYLVGWLFIKWIA